jgi:hypothetical protein
LADLINAVRAELEAAAVNARHRRLQLEVQEAQIEVEVVAKATRGAEGGLKIWVVNVGAKGDKTSGETQKVTLKLSAVTPDGSKFRVSDVSPAPVDQTQ